MSNSASWNIDRPWIDAPEPDTRIVNMNHLGRALTDYDDPPVDVLFVYNCNPAATVPDQRHVIRGLEREDLFTVVFEQVMTDTALYADVILPNTTFLEGYDFAKAYGPINLELGVPVVDAVGESRSNADVFGELCARLDLLRDDEPAASWTCSSACSIRCRARSARTFARARRRSRRSARDPSSSWMSFRTRRTARSICFPPRSNRARRRASIAIRPTRPATAIRWR